MNPSHLPDPTAEVAIARVDREGPAYIRDCVKVLRQICSLCGLEMKGTVLLEDRITGKVWKVKTYD